MIEGITLRPDQLQAVEELRAALRKHQSVLLHAECGWGKTVAAAYMAAGANAKRRRVIFGVHRRELARQTSKTFTRFRIPHGFIARGMRVDPLAHVQIASADTIRRKPELLKCSLFVPDEAHLWLADTRREMIDIARQGGAHIVPLTATPEAGNGRGLRPIADFMVHGPGAGWLIDQGFLARYKAYAPVSPDNSRLKVRAGEYTAESVEEEYSKPKVIGDRVAAYRRFANDLRMIGYAYSRANGEATAREFNAQGIPAAFLDGDTPDERRRELIEAFADGRILVLVNCQLFREGFDLSAQVDRAVTIQAVGLWSPTLSVPLAVQMMMRALRPWAGVSIILDHVNLLEQHGLPETVREWSLDGRAKPKKGGDGGEAPILTSKCEFCLFTGPVFSTCPECGTKREAVGRVVKEEEGELAEIDREALAAKRAAKQEVQGARTLAEVAAVAFRRGYKAGWIVNLMTNRGDKVTYFKAQEALIKARAK